MDEKKTTDSDSVAGDVSGQPPQLARANPAASKPRLAAGRRRTDVSFFLVMGGLSSVFILLILLLLVADVAFTSGDEFVRALRKPEIQAATRLTFLSCTTAALLSVWVATPLGYLLSRYRFPGSSLIDTLVDIPIVLPPLVLGLSLLILFHLEIGGSAAPAANQRRSAANQSAAATGSDAAVEADSGTEEASTTKGWQLERWLKEDVGFPVTYRWPAVILAQFSVACAFAVRTMRVTFDQMNPRAEDVARTLGCSRGQAFLKIALPQAWKGIIAAGTIAWARALGEFGPILVFAGATRMKTEVLSTSVFLELSIGNLDAAVAVSLLMVGMAVVVLCVLRLLGTGLNT